MIYLECAFATCMARKVKRFSLTPQELEERERIREEARSSFDEHFYSLRGTSFGQKFDE